jgi:hypothetical protein
MENWQEKIDDLVASGLSIRVEKEGRILFESAEPMLKPLLRCLQQWRLEMAGATVIDKIVGRAAAYLCVLGKVEQVLTPLASQAAKEVLQQAGITLQAQRLIPQIMNRENSGPCPMEQMANQYPSPEAFFQALS